MMRLAVIVFALPCLAVADNAPGWVLEAAKRTPPSYPVATPAVVLFQEEILTVAPDGTRTAVERAAIRILHESRDTLTAFRTYNAKSGRIRQFSGWTISPDQRILELKKDLVVDVALSQNYTYDESRAKSLTCPRTAPGTVFAYEIVEEERTVFTHYRYRFQDDLPALASRFSVTLPPGWEAKGKVFNAQVEAVRSDNTYSWSLDNLPAAEHELYSPPPHTLHPFLWLACFPPSDNKAGLRSLSDWASVSAWVSQLADPSSSVTPGIAAKAGQLTASAASELQKIQAIGQFVQQVNYVSVQMNITRGGGYTPNPADRTLQRNYGDCKDKAALMRALLKAAGIESYMVAIFSGDRSFVRPDWASPMQFNHAIIAIRVPPEVNYSTVFTDPVLGRLLPFDPTAEFTPLGDLPEEQQASYALVVNGTAGKLVQMPLVAHGNRIDTSVDAQVAIDGSLQGKMVRRHHGEAAAYMRGVQRQSADALRDLYESALTRRLGGSSIQSVNGAAVPEDGAYRTEIAFSALQFARLMQGRLLLLKPGTLVPVSDYALPDSPRKTPLKLRARERRDRISIAIPAGFQLDEAPGPIKLESRWGSYSGRFAVTPTHVTLEQSMTINDATVPPAEYQDVRTFLATITGAQQSAVVLIRN
ncbi:MAG: DUF3857 domain-containing protein [Bryobacterales bacterium]|nr:DUF3857 domain-containing protein [Bryobacterales bacterium]